MVANDGELLNVELLGRLQALEARLSRLEEVAGFETALTEKNEPIEGEGQLDEISDSNFIESKVGESGLAWLGNIVLFFGISFLVQYIQFSGFPISSAFFGYISVAGIFVLSHYLKKTYPKMASIFTLNAWLLLFYVTFHLHFFAEAPLISNKFIVSALLTVLVAVQLFISLKSKSTLLSGVALVLLGVVAVVSDSTHFLLPMTVVISAVAVLYLFRFGWIKLLYLSIMLVYVIHLLWVLNNPLMGNPLQAIEGHHFGYIYLFMVAAVFSLVALVRKSEYFSDTGIIGAIVLNGLGFALLLIVESLSFFKEGYMLLIGSVSVFCLLYSVVLQLRSEWKITAALYALFGFVTFSIAVHGYFGFPRAYFMLAIQSLLVVSMAIWFRSKFIVAMNAMLFVVLLVFYLWTSSELNGVNISFTLAALFTARILNWKKDRLTIKTEMLRNLYLIVGFIMVLITLYHAIPEKYITLSWTVSALVFFGLSLILKNVKYRYLALASMLAAAIYFFIIDLAKIELVYRIIALMFLAFISIGLSIYYSKKSKTKSEEENQIIN